MVFPKRLSMWHSEEGDADLTQRKWFRFILIIENHKLNSSVYFKLLKWLSSEAIIKNQCKREKITIDANVQDNAKYRPLTTW